MAMDYSPGQILYIRSSMGPWYYISFLRCAKPVKLMDEAYELHTCCDLCIEEDGSECLTFVRGNASLLDFDTSFAEVREATRDEIEYLYKALVKAFKDHELGWDKHFTDSTYFDILDWLAWEFNFELSTDGMSEPDPVESAMNEIQDYIWGALCKETGNYQEETSEPMPLPEMVNKQEFIVKAKAWVKNCFVGLFGEGMADNIVNEFEKYMEE